MNKHWLLAGIGLLLLSLLLHGLHVMQSMMLVIKFVSLSSGICLTSYALLESHVHKQNIGLVCSGYLIMVIFVILTIDTFVFHAITWFPGILRYPMYSLYGLPYLVFIVPGWLLCFH